MKNEQTNKLNKSNIFQMKEVLFGREKHMTKQIDEFQNAIITYCKNYNMLQSKENFFNLTLTEQFQFNECISQAINKVQNDFKTLEDFYVNCKSNCINTINDGNNKIEENINSYINAPLDVIRPNLHPCVQDCVDFFFVLNKSYYKYLVKDEGLYLELIDKKV